MSNETEIVGLSVDWRVDYSNPPRLFVHVSYADLHVDSAWSAYPTDGGTMWVRPLGGGRWEYLHHRRRDEHGFGGRVFHLRQEDGTIARVRGPWSSNTDSVRRVTGLHLMEVTLVDARGCMRAAAYEPAVLQEAADRLRAAVLIELVEHNHGAYYEIVTSKPPPPDGVESTAHGAWRRPLGSPAVRDYWPESLRPARERSSVDAVATGFPANRTGR